MKTSRNTNPKKVFPKHVQEKLAVTVLVITLALLGLVAVLYNIVKNSHDDFTQIVLSQQHYDSRVIPYKRGDIVDRNNTYLATSERVYNLIVDPQVIMSDKNMYLESTVNALFESFGYDKTEMTTLIEENKGKAYVRYKRQLSYDEKETFETVSKTINETNKANGSTAKVKGIWFEDEYKRIYPFRSTACSVIGFASGDGMNGTGGIEQSYNSTLVGTNGREYGYLNEESNLERIIKAPVNGNTIVSTIDLNIQNIVEKHINNWQTETGSKATAVIVMDPNTAEVLAMATTSQFDLNDPRNLSGLYTQAEQDAMDDEAKALAWNQMWRNYSVSDTLEPGSPSKAFTVAAAMEEGLINGSESLVCNGFLHVADRDIRCVKRTGHGSLTIEESLMQSCNSVMMQLAQRTGKERFYKYFENFGFGSKTGIDLPGEASTKSLVYNAENAGPTDLATNAFGQNYNCTMIQMAAAFSAAINGGSYYTPHVVKQILDDQGSLVKRVEPELVRIVISEATSSYLRKALHRTVSEGTGGAAKVAGYEVGGKTGTAEKYPRRQGNYVVSFMGFAPVDDPKVLVYVVIDEPNVEDQAHSSYASILFQQITAEILPYMSVFPEGDVISMPEHAATNLPQQEGITELPEDGTGESGESGETAPQPETKVYETEEYVDPIPEEVGSQEELPGGPPTAPAEETTAIFQIAP